jgi:opacity protein-like surface antigen
MKNILLAACAAIALAMGASAASADDSRYDSYGYNDNGGGGWQYQYENNGYYGDNSRQRDWNDSGYNYRHDTVSPRSIVRNLQRNDYRNISRPVLSGRFYQVKAVNPRGHYVKLYIDRYSGQIAKVKS